MIRSQLKMLQVFFFKHKREYDKRNDPSSNNLFINQFRFQNDWTFFLFFFWRFFELFFVFENSFFFFIQKNGYSIQCKIANRIRNSNVNQLINGYLNLKIIFPLIAFFFFWKHTFLVFGKGKKKKNTSHYLWKKNLLINIGKNWIGLIILMSFFFLSFGIIFFFIFFFVLPFFSNFCNFLFAIWFRKSNDIIWLISMFKSELHFLNSNKKTKSNFLLIHEHSAKK